MTVAVLLLVVFVLLGAGAWHSFGHRRRPPTSARDRSNVHLLGSYRRPYDWERDDPGVA